MKPARPWMRLAAGAVVAAAVGAAGPACPSRDLTVVITTNAADTLVTACELLPSACAKPSECVSDPVFCDPSTCGLLNACKAGNGAKWPWSPQESMGIRLLLLQIAPDSVTIANPSARCIPLNLRQCVAGPQNDGGCDAVAPGDSEQCMANAISTAVATALGSGVSFSGFTSTDGVALVVAFFRKPGPDGSGEATCDPGGALVLESDCDIANITAVAGLSALSGSSTYDINCASCQGGTQASYGIDNASCPDIPATETTTGECFLARVATALTAAPPPP